MASNSHTFIGSIDLDSPDEVIGKGFVREARNLVPRGVPPNMRYESRPGTTVVPNPFLPNTGVNLSIFSGYDANNARIFDFNFNSVGLHAIYIFSTLTQTWARLIQDGTNTSGVVLGFTATSRIHSFDIIYQDDNKGDLLYYVDSLSRPTKININRFLGTSPFTPYNPIKRSYIEVIKAPSVEAPHVTYENDTTVQANNLRNNLFQFAYTFIYDDLEESVVGTGSIVPLPINPFSNIINIPVSQDARISLYLQTGDVNVAKLKIYMRSVQNSNQFGAWQIVDTITKSIGSIPSNTYYRYLFYNDGNYPTADPLFVVLPQDFVPQNANAQALLNGNVISYGGITEGYNWLQGNFAANIVPTALPNYTVNGALFFGGYNGTFSGSQPNVELFLTGAGNNDGSGNPTSLINTLFQFKVIAKSGVTNIGFTYTNAGSATDIPTLLAAIAAAAVTAGWTLAITNTNSIVISYPTGTITFEDAQANSSNISPTNVSYAFYPNCTYSFGVVYFDAGGRTNGVITGVTANLNTLPYVPNSSTIATQIQLTINQIPPTWAVYYRVVRTDNLTYNKFTQWISNQAFSNFQQLTTNQYAYIGFSNMDDYNASLEANQIEGQNAQTVVSYGFTQGDRISIQGRYKVDGTFIPLNFDYPVLGIAPNPIINGIAQTGLFIQIAYPTGDISGTFAFDNTPDFQDYLFTVYNILKTNKNADPNTGSNEQSGNVYYETGLTFGIGNAGTNAAYHFGNIADNVVGMTDGDIFYRNRNVPIGQTYYLNGGPENESGTDGGGFFLGRITPQDPTQAAPIPQVVTSQYALGTQNFVSGGGPFVSITNNTDPPYNPFPTTEGFLFYNRSANPQTIRIRTSFTVNVTAETNMGVYLKIMTSGTVQGLALLQATEGMIPNSTTGYLINIDGTATVPPNGIVYWVLRNNNHAGTGTPHLIISQYIMRLDVVINVPLQIFDASYSDVFQLVANADNRADVENTEALQTFYSGLGRHSQPDELDTDLNNANRFYPNNTFNVDKQFGEIVRMVVNGRNLVFFQYLRVCTCGIFGQYIKTKNGANQLITTDKIIDGDNLEYYEGDNGIGNAADSLAIDGFRIDFADPVKGFLCRLSKDGITRISLLYKVQTFVGKTVPLFLNNSSYTYQFGGYPNILGCFNFVDDRDSETIFVFQGDTDGGIAGQSLAWSEDRNAWHDFYDFVPDSIVCAGNTLYSFYNGVMYIHNNTTNYCNYYGTQYKPSVTIVFNDAVGFKKTWIAVSELSNVIWNCPSIYTQVMSYGNTPQQSNLVASDFKLLEGKYEAAFLNDINSVLGLINGDTLKGTFIVIQFTVTNGAAFSWLMSPTIKFIDSPLTTK